MKEILEGRYAVDTKGNVFSLRNSHSKQRETPLKLKYRRCPGGYLSVRLFDGCNYVAWRVHRLVADTYIPNPNDLPQVNHINGDKDDNRVSNLEWLSPGDNVAHAYVLGLKKAPRSRLGQFNELHPGSRPIRQLSLSGELLQVFPSIQEAGRKGFHMSNVVSALKGRLRTSQGFRWEYAS